MGFSEKKGDTDQLDFDRLLQRLYGSQQVGIDAQAAQHGYTVLNIMQSTLTAALNILRKQAMTNFRTSLTLTDCSRGSELR